MGPRGECLACPRIQLGFGQHALHERFEAVLACTSRPSPA
jgi:hypothetical protein